MSTRIWLGTATPVAQVNTWTFSGTWLVGETITVTIGSRSWTYTLASATIATFLAALDAAYDALDEDDYPELAEMTATSTSTTLVLTADEPGVPYAATISTNSASGTIDGGASSTGVATVASAGPNHWDTAANWSGGAAPVDADDIFFENSDVPVLYGINQSSIQPASLTFRRSYTGAVGLPRWNEEGGYAEYRGQYLQIGPTALTVEADSGRIKIDTGTDQTAVVLDTGTPEEDGVPALLWKGTHASNTFEINKGSAGIAIFAGETATVATLRVAYTDNAAGDVDLVAGPGLTLTTLEQNGGSVDLSKSPTTVIKLDGELTVRDSTNVTTLTNDGGAVRWLSSGTITTLNVGHDGTFDKSRDLTPCTVTNCNVYRGAMIDDPFGTITFTNGITPVRTSLRHVTLNVGNNRTITPA